MVREMRATCALPDSANCAVWAMFSATTSLLATLSVRPQALEGFVGGEAVGCVQAVGDGDLLHFGAGEDVEGEGLGG